MLLLVQEQLVVLHQIILVIPQTLGELPLMKLDIILTFFIPLLIVLVMRQAPILLTIPHNLIVPRVGTHHLVVFLGVTLPKKC